MTNVQFTVFANKTIFIRRSVEIIMFVELVTRLNQNANTKSNEKPHVGNVSDNPDKHNP